MPLYTVSGGRLRELDADSEASPFMPVGAEFKDWKEYRELSEQHPTDDRYKAAARDEFKHMLVRLADAIMTVKSMASDEEKATLAEFLKEVSA